MILAVLEGNSKYIIDHTDENHILENHTEILEDDIYRTATGRVILANLPEAKIYDIYKNADPQYFEQMTSAGAIALANNIPMEVVPTNLINLKITHKDDMDACKLLLKSYFFEEL